jgi:hypothetical protein
MQKDGFISRKEIIERFNVDYINELIRYSDKKYPYQKAQIISKGLIEEFTFSRPTSETKVNHGGIVDISEPKINDTVQVPRELFEQFLKIMEQANTK